jgi:hypothetical protein
MKMFLSFYSGNNSELEDHSYVVGKIGLQKHQIPLTSTLSPSHADVDANMKNEISGLYAPLSTP